MDGAWRVADVRAAEQAVMARVPDGALMARAAHAIAVNARVLLGFNYRARIVLLVGAGDNGGDALYAGAELARGGARVWAVAPAPERVHRAGLSALGRAGGRLVDLRSLPAAEDVDLIVDGLVGIGASGPLRDSFLPLVGWATSTAAPVLAVDLPSGVDPDTGAVAGTAIRADLTVCLGALKPGLLVGAGRVHSGRVQIIDIGLGPTLPDADLWQLSGADVAGLLRRPGPDDDKYTRGVVGIAAGSAQYPGAAQLAVGSARLGGVGAVRYAGHAALGVSQRWPDVLVTDTVTAAGRTQCWAVGPGLGDSGAARSALEYLLDLDVPVIVDADGLTLLARDPGRLGSLRSRRSPTVLTPHDREFVRLFGDLGDDRLGAARRAADDSGAVVLLKGYATVVAEPGGRCLVNPTGSPVLATAGSGDVLSGLIGSLIASGLAPALGAGVGAFLHGLAGVRAARFGPVTATDLLPALRAVLADLQPSR